MRMKITLEINIECENINLMGLINQIKGLERECARQVINAIQEHELRRLCGERYERTGYQRCGHRTRTLTTSIGTLELKVARVRDKRTGRVFSPLEKVLGMPKRKIILGDVSLESIEQIHKLSYRKAVETVRQLSRSNLSKSTLWRRVQELDLGTEPRTDVDILLVDDTKVYSQEKRPFNYLQLVLGQNTERGEYSLQFAGVNEDWSEIRKKLESRLDLSKIYVVCDSDREINNAFQGVRGIQICHFHAVRYADYSLWTEGAPKNFRKKMRGILQSRLCILQNSVEHFWRDRDTERLTGRVEWFRQELDRWAERAEARGYSSAAGYVRRVRESLLTFAEAALRGDRVPYTNNREEREFRENAYRTKRIGARWSGDGLLQVSLCQLLSRLEEGVLNKVKEVYLGERGVLSYNVGLAGV
ncbi:MAG: ISH6 family transposase [Candidatus Hadarchaeum sp.]|uniref:ISH6 family transposase n=1 Tax=Candidatus Hadarchaeum sp. TaxID=2883567 RepID=UPI003D10BB53